MRGRVDTESKSAQRGVNACEPSIKLQWYLADKKQRPPGTLQDSAQVLGKGAVPYERSTPEIPFSAAPYRPVVSADRSIYFRGSIRCCLSYQRFHLRYETLHSRLLSRWAALFEGYKGIRPTGIASVPTVSSVGQAGRESERERGERERREREARDRQQVTSLSTRRRPLC